MSWTEFLTVMDLLIQTSANIYFLNRLESDDEIYSSFPQREVF